MIDIAEEDAGTTCIACNLLRRDFAERKEAITRDLFAHADGIEELPDGYGFRFPVADPWAAKALDFIAAEKQCCPFFTFELAFEPNDGPLWLRLRGSAEIKAFVQSELDGIVSTASLAASAPTREERNKDVVRRLIDEVMNAGRLDVIPALYSPGLAPKAERWIAPFRASFPDMHMEIIELIATGDAVVGRFKCSGTHLGDWLGNPQTGRRFTAIDEVAIFHLSDGKIVNAWSIEDTLERLEQLGLR